MALFMKQDFSPPILSRRWLMVKIRPNMLIYSRQHIISILESGLMFREDSIEVEQEAPTAEAVWGAAGGGRSGWMTRGEAVVAAAAVGACVLAFPPRSFHRSTLLKLASYVGVAVGARGLHRALCRGSLGDLLANMRDYLALARRTAACLKEFAALHAQIGSLSSVIESTHTMLCRQQSEMSILMSRASSALLGNAPWLHADVAWDAVTRDSTDNLMKIHHAFLVVQSTLLKHIAMAHYIPSVHAQRIYKNHNERIYWLHKILIEHLNQEFKQNFESLQRMYRLLKNSGNKDLNVTKKLGAAVNDSWLYSEVHTGVAKVCLELKLALNKSNSLDMLLDSCAMNKQDIDVDILSRDLDDLIDNVTKCLTTMQNSQIRLRKIKSKFGVKDAKKETINEKEVVEEKEDNILKIGDVEPEIRDEVFYCIRTDGSDDDVQPLSDLTTAPGKKEKENTKVVLTELKRKLGKREDVMRERERQALVKTMPELKNKVPEFPRQIKFEEYYERSGYIKKLKKNVVKKKLFNHYLIGEPDNRKNHAKYKLKLVKYENEDDIKGELYKTNSKLNLKSKLLTVTCKNNNIEIAKWCKCYNNNKIVYSSGMSDCQSDVEASTSKHNVPQTIKFTKKDLELSSSDSDLDFIERNSLLKDIRRQRIAKKKSYNRSIDKDVDESLKPIEYSFGTGLAMASVLQVNSKPFLSNMAQEEVFIGDGEVSTDSGNDEDA